MALAGNTVRIECEFRKFDDNLADPMGVTLKVYDGSRVLKDTITNVTKLSTGKYRCDYTVPHGSSDITFEFVGVLEGTPVVARLSEPREWI